MLKGPKYSPACAFHRAVYGFSAWPSCIVCVRISVLYRFETVHQTELKSRPRFGVGLQTLRLLVGASVI